MFSPLFAKMPYEDGGYKADTLGNDLNLALTRESKRVSVTVILGYQTRNSFQVGRRMRNRSSEDEVEDVI